MWKNLNVMHKINSFNPDKWMFIYTLCTFEILLSFWRVFGTDMAYTHFLSAWIAYPSGVHHSVCSHHLVCIIQCSWDILIYNKKYIQYIKTYFFNILFGVSALTSAWNTILAGVFIDSVCIKEKTTDKKTLMNVWNIVKSGV